MSKVDLIAFTVETMQDGADYLPRFGRKYFLRPLYDEVAKYLDVTWPQFASAMLMSHLDDGPIARADLIPALDKDLVHAGTITYENATFHFAELR